MTGDTNPYSLQLYLHDHKQDDFAPVCRIDFANIVGSELSGLDIGFSPAQFDLLMLLVASNPVLVCATLNQIAERAYEFGLEHGQAADGIIFAGSSPNEGIPPGRFGELVKKYRASIAGREKSTEPAEPCDFGGRLTGFGSNS